MPDSARLLSRFHTASHAVNRLRCWRFTPSDAWQRVARTAVIRKSTRKPFLEPLEERTPLAADGLWQLLDDIPASPSGRPSYLRATEFAAYSLEADRLRPLLEAAPLEFTQQAPVEIALPQPDGQEMRFEIVESPIMAPELAQSFPQIRTYSGRGLDERAATLRLDVTPAGLHAQILSPEGTFYVDPYYHLDDRLYVSYYAGSHPGVPAFAEFVVDASASSEKLPTTSVAASLAGTAKTDTFAQRTGAQLRTYRTAIAATGEYTAFHGGTVEAAQAAIVTLINRVTGIYEKELSIRLELLANNHLLVYTEPATDPYTNNSPSALLNENQTNLDTVIGDANYDLGHVLGTRNGGLASVGVVGVSGQKAHGVSGFPQPIGDPFYVDIVAHELGHQFNANHSFNGSNGACSGNRVASSAYEPGSGSTIMSYAGICGSDNLQGRADPYLHSINFDEILDYVDFTIPHVGTRTTTGNAVPSVSAGDDYTIPARTPFTLTATGSDADAGDQLTFNWEERDLGPQQSVHAGDNGSSPLFRSFQPTPDPTRTLPRLVDLLADTTTIGETLPTTTRTMNFRATVRDNRAGGGGVNADDMTLQVIDTGSSFRVTSPDTAVQWPAASSQTVTWDVAGTVGNGIDARFVNILLSADGGNSFPIVLATNVANDGTHDVVLPHLTSSAARIRVEAAGNIFFDISNADFVIGAPSNLLDFGDAPAGPYPTRLSNDGARHVIGGPRLGAAVDTESDGQPNASATGDGIDEDGVVFISPLIAGTTVDLQVTSSLGGGHLDYFFDFDRLGGWGNKAQEIFQAQLFGGPQLISLAIPADAVGTTLARFRISSAGGLGPAGLAADGEVEDYAVEIFAAPPQLDFGDAPDPAYASLLANDGPRHVLRGPRLGLIADGELEAQPNGTATGDGSTDDGVTFRELLVAGSTTTIGVTSALGGGSLDFFFDFDADGTFGSQPNEVFSASLTGGPQTVAVAIPLGAVLGSTFARFRLSSAGGLPPTGLALDGEVEDYQIVIAAATNVGTIFEDFDLVTVPSLPAGWTSTSTVSVAWTTNVNNSDSAPNHAFVANVGFISDNRLTSPPVPITSANARIGFRHHYNTEATYDGGVLEISIGDGPFLDIVVAGGTFLAGGYAGTIDPDFGNPLAGRPAWTGNSGGYVDTLVDLPPAAIGKTVQLRWREGTDSSVSDVGWRVDTIRTFGQRRFDYGDAPDPSYPTLVASQGAAHLVGGPRLGSAVDFESEAQANATATGDDLRGAADDEDGIGLPGSLPRGRTIPLTVIASSAALLNAWIDFKGDGDWSDSGEQWIKDRPLSAGVNRVEVEVPAGATLTPATFARFRLSNQAGLSFDGSAADGEVEDYQLAIHEPHPIVIGHSVNADNPSRSRILTLALTFDRPVNVTAASSLLVQNHTTGAGIDMSAATLEGNGTTTVRWHVASLVFADGYYTATLPRTQARSTTGGLPLEASYAMPFHALVGDGDGDATASFNDYFPLQNNFGKSVPVLGPGDLDGNGFVDIVDFFILQNNFEKSLSPLELDFGDAGETNGVYPTTLAYNGPRHYVGAGLLLGTKVDHESNGQPNATATGDDLVQTDDEDGLSLAVLSVGSSTVLRLTATLPVGSTAVVNGWIDFNADGDWDDAGEQVFADRSVGQGTTDLPLAVPVTASTGPTFARFRLTAIPGFSYYGLAPTGEVEDYQVTLVAGSSSSRARPPATEALAAPKSAASGSPHAQVPAFLAVSRGGDNGDELHTILALPSEFARHFAIPVDRRLDPRVVDLAIVRIGKYERSPADDLHRASWWENLWKEASG